MAAGEIHQWDYGTQFVFQVLDQNSNPVDVSSATVMQVMFLVPPVVVLNPLYPAVPGTNTFVRNLSFLNTGTDGNLTYTTVSGEINAMGLYRFQLFIVGPSGAYNSDITTFKVYDNLYIGSLP